MPAMFTLNNDNVTIEVASISQNIYIVYKATAEGQEFSQEERPIIPEGILKLNFCKFIEDDGQGSTTDMAYLSISEGPAYLDDYIRQIISDGQTDSFWMEILGAFTGSFGEQGSFSGVFRYTKADLTNMETFGVYADVSAESKLQLDSADEICRHKQG